MTATLARLIGTQTTRIHLVGSPTLPPPIHARLDDEIVIIASFLERNGAAVIARGQLGTVRQRHAAGTNVVELTWPDDTKAVDDGRLALFGYGPPADGPDGTGAFVGAAGSQYTDLSSGIIHVSTGPAESPSWHGQDHSGGGPGGGDKTFAHHQTQAAATWIVQHNLGKVPAVTVLDSARTQVIGDVTYVDANRLEVHFSAPFSGVAVCN